MLLTVAIAAALVLYLGSLFLVHYCSLSRWQEMNTFFKRMPQRLVLILTPYSPRDINVAPSRPFPSLNLTQLGISWNIQHSTLRFLRSLAGSGIYETGSKEGVSGIDLRLSQADGGLPFSHENRREKDGAKKRRGERSRGERSEEDANARIW